MAPTALEDLREGLDCDRHCRNSACRPLIHELWPPAAQAAAQSSSDGRRVPCRPRFADPGRDQEQRSTRAPWWGILYCVSDTTTTAAELDGILASIFLSSEGKAD